MTSREFVRSDPASNDSGERSKAVLDLTLSLLAFALCFLFVPHLNPFLRAAHGFKFVLATALYQLCAESLAPVTLLLLRRESFFQYGFCKKKFGSSIALGVLLALLYNTGISLYSHALLWVPLRRQPAIRMSLAAGFPLSLLGIVLAVVVWAFWKASSASISLAR